MQTSNEVFSKEERVVGVLDKVAPDMRTKVGERAKALSFAFEALCLMERRERQNGCKSAIVWKAKGGKNR